MAPETQEIIQLYKKGKAVSEIVSITGYKLEKVTHAVGSARKRGDITHYNGRPLSVAVKKKQASVIRKISKGMTYKDVAAQLGMPMGSVSGIVNRARERGELSPVMPRKGSYIRAYVRANDQKFGRISSAASNLSDDAVRWVVDRTVAGGYESVAEMLIDEILERYEEEKANE